MLSNLRRLLCIVLLALGLTGLLVGGAAAETAAPVLVAPVTGIINPVQAGYVGRVLDEAQRRGAAAVVLQLDTPGGLDTSMREIIRRILGSPVPVVVYVSPPGSRAASAGVFITYASHVAAMAPNTNIGSAHPVAMGQNGESQMSDEMTAKVTNDAVAYIRGLAERRGRNVDWAEQAVRQSVNVTVSDAVQQHIVDLQAADVPDLLRKIDGRTVDLATGPAVLHTAGAPVEELAMNPVESLLHAISDPTIAYILLGLGSLGLMLELYNPGGILPGVIGGLCLLLALYALGTLPVNYAGLLLIGFAFLLFTIDVLASTHGILTLGGAVAFVLGSLLLFNAPDSAPFFQVSLPAIVAMTAVLIGFFVFVVGAVVRSRHRKSVTGREALIGKLAGVRTRLAPEGYVHVEGELWRARTTGRSAEPGEDVRVIGFDGLLLTVEPIGSSAPLRPAAEAEPPSTERPAAEASTPPPAAPGRPSEQPAEQPEPIH